LLAAAGRNEEDEDMNSQLAVDRAGIEDLLHRFSYAVDSNDLTAISACFTEDAVMTLEAVNGQSGTRSGRDQILEVMGSTSANRAKTGYRRHLITNLVVLEHDADTAHTRCYVTTLRLGEDEIRINTSGIYTDRLVRTSDGWLIKERHGRFDNNELIGTFWVPA
jgi:uncharacterized protein (TIGR02246 family)